MISVIIPLYNKEFVVAKSIESVINQTYIDFELIIIDDGSTDNSIESVKKFKDPRIVLISKKNGGVSEARNTGIKAAKFDYIFFLDADDILTKDCLMHFAELINKYAKEVFFSANFELVSENNKKIYCRGKVEKKITNPQKGIWDETIFPRTGSMLIKKDCFIKSGIFNSKIAKFEDLDLILRILRNFTIVYSPRVVLEYQVTFAEQSKRIIPLEHEFANYLNFSDAGFYEKLLLGRNLKSVIKQRKLVGDFKTIAYLKKKYKYNFYFANIASTIWRCRYHWRNLFTKNK